MERKRPRIVDVARLAGVSSATVSRVLHKRCLANTETYRKVTEAMHALGYENPLLKRDAAEKRARDLIIMSLPTINNPFYNAITHGAQHAAQRFGYQILLCNQLLDAEGLATLIDLVKENRVAGVITLDALSPKALERLCAVTQVVQCCEYCEGLNHSYVSIDDNTATRTALEYLLSRGRKNIAFVNGPLRYKYARHRQDSYIAFMRENGLTVRDDWMIQLSDIDFTIAEAAVTQMLSRPVLPDAIFAISDVFAVAVIKAAKHLGLEVPRDLMVVGFDNIDISTMTDPPITTVNQPKKQLGYMACELLIEQILNPAAKPKHILLNTEFIVRESTMG